MAEEREKRKNNRQFMAKHSQKKGTLVEMALTV
jgi:hypothetical protein